MSLQVTSTYTYLITQNRLVCTTSSCPSLSAISSHTSRNDTDSGNDAKHPSDGVEGESGTELGIVECNREPGSAMHVHHKGKGSELEGRVKNDETSYNPPDSSPPRVCADTKDNGSQGKSSESNGQFDGIAGAGPCSTEESVFIIATIFVPSWELAAVESFELAPDHEPLANLRQAVLDLITGVHGVTAIVRDHPVNSRQA